MLLDSYGFCLANCGTKGIGARDRRHYPLAISTASHDSSVPHLLRIDLSLPHIADGIRISTPPHIASALFAGIPSSSLIEHAPGSVTGATTGSGIGRGGPWKEHLSESHRATAFPV